VAKAFGCWLGVMYSLGIGMFARAVRSSIISKYCGSCSRETGTARADLMASLSLNQYEPPTITRPRIRPMARPPEPPSTPPATMTRPPIAARRVKVFAVLIMIPPLNDSDRREIPRRVALQR
jgi:hypothetical protein